MLLRVGFGNMDDMLSLLMKFGEEENLLKLQGGKARYKNLELYLEHEKIEILLWRFIRGYI